MQLHRCSLRVGDDILRKPWRGKCAGDVQSWREVLVLHVGALHTVNPWEHGILPVVAKI